MSAFVRFTNDAVEDLEALKRRDPQIVRQVLKKCLLLEQDPAAGEPLLGGLVGFRKLVVGDRDYRIVWRETTDEVGQRTIEIAEVWAVGARSDGEIYNEMSTRVSAMDPQGPVRHALEHVIEALAPDATITATREPVDDPVPRWLRDRLVHTARMSSEAVDQLKGAEAADLWDAYQVQGTL